MRELDIFSFHGMQSMNPTHRLVDFHGHVTLLHLFFGFMTFFFFFNLTLKRLQMCSEVTKPIFNI